MQSVLITGAAGGIGTRLRALLKGVYPQLRVSDIRRPADLAPDENFVAADLADLKQVEHAVAGIEGIVHLGGISVDRPWGEVLPANIIGCYNLSRRRGGKRSSAWCLPPPITPWASIRGAAGSASTPRCAPIRTTA